MNNIFLLIGYIPIHPDVNTIIKKLYIYQYVEKLQDFLKMNGVLF